MNKIFGIDISRYQKGIDLKSAKAEGVRFVIIKASQTDYTDPCFEDHYKNAKAEGLAVGAYHYLTAQSEEEAVRQADCMAKALSGKSFEYPVYADCEDKLLKALPRESVDRIITAFCKRLEAYGYFAGFYCNYDFYRNYCSGETLSKRFTLWLASWSREPKAECPLWQFGGETNLIRSNRIAGRTCDQNYSFTDFESIIRAKGKNGFSASASHSTPAQGDRVMIEKNAPTYDGKGKFASWVYDTKLYVREIKGDRAVVSTVKSGPVTGAVNTKYLKNV